jgi:hypothetical protein
MPLKRPPFDPYKQPFHGLAHDVGMTRVPMMQVIEEDIYQNYVVCRGYDPDHKKFFNRLYVAKPYGQRGQTGIYAVGEVHPAVKAITRLGLTPGVARDTVGHPADLDEQVDKLTSADQESTDSVVTDISWMFIGSSGSTSYFGKLDSDLAYDTDEEDEITLSIYSDATTDTGNDLTPILPPHGMRSGIIPKGDNCYRLIRVEKEGSAWRVTDFPTHFWGELAEAMTSGSDTDVAVGTSTFSDVKPPPFYTGDLADETGVRIGLDADGYWYMVNAPCESS